MRVILVPLFHDNYSYLLINGEGEAAAIDPAEPDKVLWAAVQQRATVSMVLCTHRHADHAGGNKALLRQMPDLEIVGGAGDGVPAVTRQVADGEVMQFGDVEIRCIHTPFHTKGSVCYLCSLPGNDAAVLFSGDTLFVGGAGRLMEGTAQQMHASLQRLAALPDATLVYCGHEYGLSNLEWAATLDPANPELLRKLQWAQEQRRAGRPTVPSSIGEERQTNLFLRCGEPALQRTLLGQAAPAAAAGETTSVGAAAAAAAESCSREAAEVAALAELRRRKDHATWSASLATRFLGVARWFGLGP